MKIKILWGFIGNAALLGAGSNKVKAGAVFDDANDEYAHALIGKGLAEQVAGDGRPKASKQAATKPSATKPAATKPAVPGENQAAGAASAGESAGAPASAAATGAPTQAPTEGGAAAPGETEAE